MTEDSEDVRPAPLFTREDVAMLNAPPDLASDLVGTSVEGKWLNFLASLATRISSLLPPEDDQ